MFEMRQSRLDREDQLDDMLMWDELLRNQTQILERRIQEAKDNYDKHLEHMAEREVFRNKLMESLK